MGNRELISYLKNTILEFQQMRTAITIIAVLGAMLVGTSVYQLQASHALPVTTEFPGPTPTTGDILYIGNAQGQITQWSIYEQKQTRKLLSPHSSLITAL